MGEIIDRLLKELDRAGKLTLVIRARPDSAKTEIIAVLADGSFKINIAAPPVKGRANQELIQFLARQFKVEREQVQLSKGEKSREKIIKICK